MLFTASFDFVIPRQTITKNYVMEILNIKLCLKIINIFKNEFFINFFKIIIYLKLDI